MAGQGDLILGYLDSVANSVAFCAVLAGALAFAWRAYRRRYLGLWAIFWALYVAVWALDGLAVQLEPAAPAGVLVHLGMTAASFTARTLLALGVADYLGWRPPGPGGRRALAAGIVGLTAAGALTHHAVATGAAPALVSLPFRTYFVGLFLGTFLTVSLLRTPSGPGLSARRLLALATAAGAASDGWDVVLETFGASPWTSSGEVLRLSYVVAHVCDALFATGMLVAAIGTERERAEQAAAEVRERDARLQEARGHERLAHLAASMAHDFNNLLAAVTAHLALAREELPADAPARADVDAAAGAARRGMVLSRQLLTLSLSQRGRADADGGTAPGQGEPDGESSDRAA
jgi:signal transduction histidine kinase